MNLSKTSKKGDDKTLNLQSKYNALVADHNDLKKEFDDTKAFSNVFKSDLDKHLAAYAKDKKTGKGDAKDTGAEKKWSSSKVVTPDMDQRIIDVGNSDQTSLQVMEVTGFAST